MGSTPEIALFANRGSPQTRALAEILTQMGVTAHELDIQLGGEGRSRTSLAEEAASWNGVDLTRVRAVHIRCTAPNTLPLLPPVLNQASHSELRSRYLREQEYSAATYAFFEGLARRGTLVVNPLTSAYLDHNAKAQFYEKLRAHAIPVPRTLTTGDPDAAAGFIAEVGEAVAKPQIGVGSTRLVTEDDQQRLEEVRRCPVMLQERIHGPTVRVHIVGDTVVLALKILSEDQVDSRTETRGFEYHELPGDTQQTLVRANRLLGLHYAAWDVISDDRDHYFALDCNPGPFIMWIGPDNVRSVLSELAGYLVRYAQTGSIDDASAGVRACPPPTGHGPN